MSSSLDIHEAHSVRGVLTEHAALNQHLHALVGQPILFARFTYGDELTLHFGAEVPYTLPRFGRCVNGEYMLGCRGSDWLLSTPAGEWLSTAVDREAADAVLAQLPVGARVTVADACPWRRAEGEWSYSLLIKCEPAIALTVLPEGVLDPEGLEDWEIFLPEDRLLSVGPGLKYRLGSSIT